MGMFRRFPPFLHSPLLDINNFNESKDYLPDEKDGLQRDVADEYKNRAHADIVISLAMGDSTSVPTVLNYNANATAKWEAITSSLRESI